MKTLTYSLQEKHDDAKQFNTSGSFIIILAIIVH